MSSKNGFFIESPGLYYIGRDGTFSRLDYLRPGFVPMQAAFIPRPERDMLIALLRWVLETLLAQQASDSVLTLPDDSSSPHHS